MVRGRERDVDTFVRTPDENGIELSQRGKTIASEILGQSSEELRRKQADLRHEDLLLMRTHPFDADHLVAPPQPEPRGLFGTRRLSHNGPRTFCA